MVAAVTSAAAMGGEVCAAVTAVVMAAVTAAPAVTARMTAVPTVPAIGSAPTIAAAPGITAPIPAGTLPACVVPAIVSAAEKEELDIVERWRVALMIDAVIELRVRDGRRTAQYQRRRRNAQQQISHGEHPLPFPAG